MFYSSIATRVFTNTFFPIAQLVPVILSTATPRGGAYSWEEQGVGLASRWRANLKHKAHREPRRFH